MSNRQAAGIKETLTSLTIAFMMAFVFRGFVIEGFIIPTGSMAPTLLGQHVRFVSPHSGYDWPTNPWDTAGPGMQGLPLSRQGAGDNPPLGPTDPMTGLQIDPQRDRRLAAGDRVFVLKYLPGVHRPSRWDVVVFKYPGDHQNFIKRLVGLPGEQVVMVDGDIFYREYIPGVTSSIGPHAWREAGWRIARKPERTQRTMFQPVFDSRYLPVRPEPAFRAPISPDDAGSWSGMQEGRVWTYTGSGHTALRWNDRRPITDYYPYNQASHTRNRSTGEPLTGPFTRSDDPSVRGMPPYPVSDLSLRISVEPTDTPVAVTPTVEARGFVFQGVVDPIAGTATVRMRPENGSEPWTELDSASFDGLRPGRVTEIEFWHVDQALWLFVDGRLVCGGKERGAYSLSPAQRAEAALTLSFDELVEHDRQRTDGAARPGVSGPGVLARPELYRRPALGWEFAGGPVRVHRVRVERDIFYQPMPTVTGRPTRGAHYDNFPTLTGDQFFMLGDNSPASEDSRLWVDGSLDPWVQELIDPTPGTVHRDLIVGKAFIVYFPAPLDGGPLLAPDIGRVRWIW
ncbi:MAG: S26 family signal peptidase [Phycisphaerales bacterium]|nr:hypothetical protein [Planctomycetota bacterium]MCH8508170.1 S26 family signal peptidase [Phycisphaerales bacterium]